jgi:hypothetical protein
MKLPKGMTIATGARTYRNEIPDTVAKAIGMDKVIVKEEKRQADLEAAEKAKAEAAEKAPTKTPKK